MAARRKVYHGGRANDPSLRFDFAQLRRAGTPIPSNDLWIAALVVQNALALCTADHPFALIPQLTRV